MNFFIVQSKDYREHTLKEYIHDAHTQKADAIILPEAFSFGFQFNQLEDQVRYNDSLIEKLKIWASKFKISIIGSLFLRDQSDKIYNTGFLIKPDNRAIAAYKKAHLISVLKEDTYLQKGFYTPPIPLHDLMIGLGICYDLRFPEFFREHTKNNADLFIIPSQWPSSRINHMILLARARAIENQTMLILVNSLQGESGGNSMVIDADGEVLIDIKEENSSVLFKTDFSRQKKYRDEFPSRSEFLQEIR